MVWEVLLSRDAVFVWVGFGLFVVLVVGMVGSDWVESKRRK